MKFGSLFDGIYGFGLAFERAGMECAWVSEIDKNCNALMELRRPNITNLGDVRNVTGRNAEPVEVICGGFPCQDLSVAGKRAGLAGERSGLWFEFHRVLTELKPRWVVVENVPGLLSSDEGRDFAVILRGLVELGYGVAWRVLDAQYFGVPQRRRRVFIVGSLGDGRAAQVLFEPESLSGDSAPRREAGQGIADPITRSFAKHGRASAGKDSTPHNAIVIRNSNTHGNGWGVTEELMPALGCSDAVISFKNRGGYGVSVSEGVALSLENEGGLHQGGQGRLPNILLARSTGAGFYSEDDKASIRANQGGTTFDIIAQPLRAGRQYSDMGDGQTNVIAFTMEQEPKWGDMPGTLGTYNGRRAGVASASVGVRRLTPLECERLQGFPDGWTEGFADSVRYRMLGNAVAVPVVEWIANRIAVMPL